MSLWSQSLLSIDDYILKVNEILSKRPDLIKLAKKISEINQKKEPLMSEVIQSEALINLLDRKGIISKQELLEEMRRVKTMMIKSKGGSINNEN